MISQTYGRATSASTHFLTVMICLVFLALPVAEFTVHRYYVGGIYLLALALPLAAHYWIRHSDLFLALTFYDATRRSTRFA